MARAKSRTKTSKIVMPRGTLRLNSSASALSILGVLDLSFCFFGGGGVFYVDKGLDVQIWINWTVLIKQWKSVWI